MRETYISKRDKELMDLRDHLRKVVKSRRQWLRFVDYVADYYPIKK